MKSLSFIPLTVGLLLAHGGPAWAAPRTVVLNNPNGLELHGVKAENIKYRGRQALKLTEASPPADLSVAVLKDLPFRDGTIELDVSGAPSAGATEGARGFVGVAFRAGPGAGRFEYFYLRPTNGRVEDQVRRNHSVQYASHPDYPWQRLRKEEPEKYESYVDLEPGVWTKMRIVVSGHTAKLYVNGAAQPVLIVNDLKLGPAEGGIALWIGPGTVGHFASLTVTE
jgi:hypothetical protein